MTPSTEKKTQATLDIERAISGAKSVETQAGKVSNFSPAEIAEGHAAMARARTAGRAHLAISFVPLIPAGAPT